LQQLKSDNQYFIDRQYRRDESFYDRRDDYHRDEDKFRDKSNDKFQNRRFRKCFVCNKFKCWSTNHSEKKRDDSKKRFFDRYSQFKDTNRLHQYILEYESNEKDDDHEEMIQYFEKMTLSISESLNTNFINAVLNDFESDELFLISVHQIDNVEFITSTLPNKTFAHRLISKDDTIEVLIKLISYSYITSSELWYDDREFKSLLIDSDAARKSIEKMRQFKILQQIFNHDVKLNKSNQLTFKFEIEDTKSVDSIELEISLKMIIFHIVEINILFLLSLVDLDRLRVYFNNLTNELIHDLSQIDLKNRHSVIRRYEHAFLLWKIFIHSLIVESLNENSCFLIEIELRRLHRRFDHFSTRRLHQILDRAKHDVDSRFIEHLIRYCHHC
jgi:hypothetical protein